MEASEEEFPLDWYEYRLCPACERVIHDPQMDLTLYEVAPCPRCGDVGQPRYIWPSRGRLSLEIIDVHGQARGGEEHEQREDAIRCVFLAAAFEALLQAVLWNLLARSGTPKFIALALHNRARQRSHALNLYRELVGLSARKVLDHEGKGAWYGAWDAVANARNAFGHGEVAAIGSATLEAARTGAFSAFAVLHNAAMDSVDRRVPGAKAAPVAPAD